MERMEVLDQLKAARRAHQKWLQNAHSLINNMVVKENDVPVKYTNCSFGIWLYSDAQKLRQLEGIDYLDAITTEHQKLHEEYQKIYNIYFAQDNRSFFGKLFNSKPIIFHDDQQLAKKSYLTLKVISENLLNLIELLERRITTLPRSAFDAIE